MIAFLVRLKLVETAFAAGRRGCAGAPLLQLGAPSGISCWVVTIWLIADLNGW